ncbi:CsbD family protein [uncultured Hydrogenophaga sp.]|nr:CsbD family protein [uncultured Hydrogenophaga sp.]
MNKDQIKGTLKSAAGKVQQATGKAMGSSRQELEGVKKQPQGKA